MGYFSSYSRITAAAAIVTLLFGLFGIPVFHECSEIRGWKTQSQKPVPPSPQAKPCHGGGHLELSGAGRHLQPETSQAASASTQHQHDSCLLCYFHLQLCLLFAIALSLVLAAHWVTVVVGMAPWAPGLFIYYKPARARAPPMPAG